MAFRMLLVAIVSAFLCLPATQAAADDYDGSLPILCALKTGIECSPNGECVEVSVDDLGLPPFVMVDLKENTIGGYKMSGKHRQTTIERSEREEGRTILQGGENGRGWSIVIVEENGDMSAAVAGDDVAFTLFGTCTPL